MIGIHDSMLFSRLTMLVSLLILLSLFGSMGYAAEVLIMPSSLFPVHRRTMRILAEELVSRNHTVVWVEYGLEKPKTPLPNDVYEIFWKVPAADDAMKDLYLYRNHSVHRRIWDADFDDSAEQTTAWMSSIKLCEQVLSIWKSQFDALVAKKFTTVVLDDLYNPCGLLLVGLQKSVCVYWSMTALRTESAWAHQSPSPPSYLPVPGTGFADDLSFQQRFLNLASYFRRLYIHQHIILRRIDALFEKFYPKQLPEAFYIERNASVNYVNTPQIFDFARPYMPRVVFVGAIQCRKAKPITGELERFINGADEKNGVIVFTTGFTAQWKYAPKSTIDAFLSAFAARPKTRFVWQYNGHKFSNLPSNVFVSDWIPLQDILGHSKTRAHISHGGLNSIIESVWHGVPVIGFPLTAWGYDNLLRITERKVGVMLEKRNLHKDTILHSLDEIYEEKYKKEMLIFQDLVIDVPYTELNHSAFWIEFIERHNEVPHARSGADELNVLQYFMVDIVVFVLSIALSVIATVVILLRYLLRMICGQKHMVAHKKQE